MGYILVIHSYLNSLIMFIPTKKRIYIYVFKIYESIIIIQKQINVYDTPIFGLPNLIALHVWSALVGPSKSLLALKKWKDNYVPTSFRNKVTWHIPLILFCPRFFSSGRRGQVKTVTFFFFWPNKTVTDVTHFFSTYIVHSW